MKELRKALLIFGWSLPFFLLLGTASLFGDDEFLGIWILLPWNYPLSYSILMGIALACGTILSYALGKLKNLSQLAIILVGISLGALINIILVTIGLTHWVVLAIENTQLIIMFLTWPFLRFLSLFVDGEIVSLFPLSVLWITLLIILQRLFSYLSIRLSQKKEKILLLLLIVMLPLLPSIFFPFVGLLIGCRFSLVERSVLPSYKRIFLAVTQISLIILSWLWIIKSYHLPGLIIPLSLRHNWGIAAFNYDYDNYKKLSQKLSNCQLLKKEIAEIQATGLVEGKNYLQRAFFVGDNHLHLNIQLIGEKGTAIFRGCLVSDGCFPHLYGLKKENENKAKLFTQSEVKTIDISKCVSRWTNE